MLRTVLTLAAAVVFMAAGWSAPVPKGLKAKAPPRAKIEPLKGEKVYTVDFQNTPFEKVVEALEKLTDLMFLSKACPDLHVTVYAQKVCASELFAQVNDDLFPNGFALVRKTQSFSVMKTDAPLQRIHVPTVSVDQLERKSPLEPVQMILPAFDEVGVEKGLKAAEGIKQQWFEVKSFGTDKLLVIGRAGDVRKLVSDTEELFKEREAEARKAQWEIEVFGGPRPRPQPRFRW